MNFPMKWVLWLMIPVCLPAQGTKIVRNLASVRTLCTEEMLKNQETNLVLFEVLDQFYTELEDSFRRQVQRSTPIRFAYWGEPSPNTISKFVGRIVRPNEAMAKCDATVSPAGEIQAITAGSYRVTVYFNISRNPTPEEADLNEADRGMRLRLWGYKLISNTFTREKLRYTADYGALELAASLLSALRAPAPQE